MTKPRYRVSLVLEPVDPAGTAAAANRFECATLPSRQEAEDFILQLLHDHCACVTGEAKLLAEMTAPEIYTAGD